MGKNRVGRPRIIETPEEFDRLVDEYVAECRDEGKPLTLTGLCLHLGFADRRSLYDYQDRPEFSQSAKRARLFVEASYEEHLYSRSATGPIFALKNFGWSDRQQIEHSGPEGGPIELDDRERARRIAALLERARARRNRQAPDDGTADAP